MSDLVTILSQMKPSQLKVLTNLIYSCVGLGACMIILVCATMGFIVWVLRFPHQPPPPPAPVFPSHLDKMLAERARGVLEKAEQERHDEWVKRELDQAEKKGKLKS